MLRCVCWEKRSLSVEPKVRIGCLRAYNLRQVTNVGYKRNVGEASVILSLANRCLVFRCFELQICIVFFNLTQDCPSIAYSIHDYALFQSNTL